MPKKQERGAVATSQVNGIKSRKITQEDEVLNHLKKHGSITSMTAFRLYDITRLSAKIFTLRKRGYEIETLRETSPISGKTYGRYILREEVA